MKKSHVLGYAAILFTLAVVTYVRAFGLGFVNFDDNIYVFDNPHVKAGLTKESILYAFTTYESGNWIPLTWLSYQLDTTCFGFRPLSYHVDNVLLHGLNTALLFLWLYRATGTWGRSFAVAALFAVHPLHVESVAWISERKNVLSTFFFLLMLIAYDHYTQRRTLSRFFLVVLAFAMGLLSKSMLVTAPLILWIIDFWPPSGWDVQGTKLTPNVPHRSAWWIFGEKCPLLLLSLAIGLLTIRSQDSGTTTPILSFYLIPMSNRIGNAVIGYGWYVMKTVMPTGLCAMYSHPLQRLSWSVAAGAALFLFIVTVIIGWTSRRRTYLAFGWIWFLMTLLPVIGLMQVGSQAYADRYIYIPQIGLWIVIVWQAELGLRSFPRGQFIGRCLLVTALVVFSSLTFRQIGFWKDTETLWTRAVSVSPDNWAAHWQLGFLRYSQKQLDESSRHFKAGLELNPTVSDAWAQLGWIEQLRGDVDAAQSDYERCLKISPSHESAMHDLVRLLKQRNRFAQALPYLIRYTQHRPGDALMRNQLGLIYARSGDFEKARIEFAQVVKLIPEDWSTHTNLGLALTELGQFEEAQKHLEAVVAAQPANPNAHVNLGSHFARRGMNQEALQQFESALKINPNDQDALSHRERLRRAQSK